MGVGWKSESAKITFDRVFNWWIKKMKWLLYTMKSVRKPRHRIKVAAILAGWRKKRRGKKTVLLKKSNYVNTAIRRLKRNEKNKSIKNLSLRKKYIKKTVSHISRPSYFAAVAYHAGTVPPRLSTARPLVSAATPLHSSSLDIMSQYYNRSASSRHLFMAHSGLGCCHDRDLGISIRRPPSRQWASFPWRVPPGTLPRKLARRGR